MNLIRLAAPMVLANGFAQVVTFAIMPLLTRHYSDADFGFWSLFIAIASLITIGSAFRYDLGILLPSSVKDVIRMTVISVKNVLFTVLMSIVFVCLAFKYMQGISWVYFLLPISILFCGLNLVLTANLNYLKKYKSIAVASLLQSLANVVLNIILCFMFAASAVGLELIIATIFGQFIFLAVQSKFLGLDFRYFSFIFKQKYSMILLKKYSDLPIYSMPASYLSSVTSGMPIFAMGYLFTIDLVGQYALANRVLVLPLSIMGAGLYQVLLKMFAQKVSAGDNICGDLVKIWLVSLMVSVIPASAVFFYAEFIVTTVFGPQWIVAGQLLSLLIFPLLFNFCINLTSASHVVLRLQHLALYFSVLMLVGKILVTVVFKANYFDLLLWYTLVDSAGIVGMNLVVVKRLRNLN